MPGRKFDGSSLIYRYGFNGKENDDEIKGEGNQQDYGMRIYDTKLGRFLSVDPAMPSYPWYSPYQFAGNKPIMYVDIDGLEEGFNIRFEQMQKGYLKGTVTEKELREFHKSNAVGSFIGIGILLTRGAILRYGPGLALWGANPSNQQILIGLGGLTASILDPNPMNDYPGSLDEVGKGVSLLIKKSKVERFIVESSKFEYFFGKIKAGVNATQRQLDNVFKSTQRSEIFKKLGFDESIDGREKLVELFDNALSNGKEISRYTDEFGTTITKQILVKKGEQSGKINVSFLYRNGKSTPEVTTAVPELID